VVLVPPVSACGQTASREHGDDVSDISSASDGGGSSFSRGGGGSNFSRGGGGSSSSNSSSGSGARPAMVATAGAAISLSGPVPTQRQTVGISSIAGLLPNFALVLIELLSLQPEPLLVQHGAGIIMATMAAARGQFAIAAQEPVNTSWQQPQQQQRQAAEASLYIAVLKCLFPVMQQVTATGEINSWHWESFPGGVHALLVECMASYLGKCHSAGPIGSMAPPVDSTVPGQQSSGLELYRKSLAADALAQLAAAANLMKWNS